MLKLARSLALFVATIALVMFLHPSFLPDLSYYLKAPRIAGAMTPRRAYNPRDEVPPKTDPARMRIAEVADGRRAFDAGDFETHNRQEWPIRYFTEFWSRDPFWRKPSLARRAGDQLDLRECLDQVALVTFHLDGLDARGDFARHAVVFEAALRYVEELAETGLGRDQPLVALALIADERLVRQALRHARAYPPDARAIAALSARLTAHFRRVGDLRALADRKHLVRVNEFLLTVHEAKWPTRVPLEWERWGASSEVPDEYWAQELAALNRALKAAPHEGLAQVVAHRLAKERARLEPMDWQTRMRGLLLGDRRILFRQWDADFAHAAYVRQLEWSALRTGALEALLRLTPASRVALRHAPGPFALTDDRDAVYAIGRDGRDEHGQGDDYPIWPPAPVAGLAPVPAPASRAFSAPDRVLTRLLAELATADIDWEVAQVTRPRGSVDLLRAHVEVVTRRARFHSLGAFLTRPTLGSSGAGEMLQLAGDRRALRFEVPLERGTAQAHAAPTVHRVAGGTTDELEREIARVTARRHVDRLVVVRLPRGLECTAVVRATDTSGAADTRRAAR